MVAPILSGQTGSVTGPTSLNGSVSTDQGNGTLYWVTTTSVTQPTVAQIKAGQDHLGATAPDSASQTVIATGTQNVKADGLIPSTIYFFHFVHTNSGAEDSNRVTTAALTTNAIGTAGVSSVYIKDANGVWNEFTAYEYFKVIKRLNQLSEFEMKVYDIQATEKAYVKEFSEIMFFSETVLILKGRIQKVVYGTAFEATLTGFGMEAQLLDKELTKNSNTSASWTDSKRGQWSNVSAQTIAKEILSENTNGVTPWIIQPNTTGLFSADYGLIHVRFEYANRLKALAKLGEFIDYEWRISQTSNFSNRFDMITLIPDVTSATVSQQTFTITGVNTNANLTEKETDITNLANKIDFLAYGDGATQLTTSCYNASATFSTLSADISDTATTISLTDASGFAASGTIRIMEEQITYTGKTGNNLTGATRGANSTIAFAHKKNVFVEKHLAIASAEAGSSIFDNGLLDITVVNKEIIDRATAELAASNELLNRLDPIVRIRVQPSEPQDVAGDREVGDLITITDAEADISGDFRIVGMTYISDFGSLSLEIEASNKTLTFIEQMKKNQEATDSLQRYVQGSTNIYSVQSYENADATNNLNIRFFLPSEVIALNSVKVNFKLKDFRAYSSSNANESAHTHRIPSLSVNSHSHNIVINAEPIGDLPVVGFSAGSLFSTFGGGTTTTAATNTSTTASNTSAAGSAHTHGINYGIFEEALVSPSVDVYVGEDGGTLTLKATYITDQTNVDITSLVAAVGAGKWIDVQFRPNKRMRIEANVHLVCFISTQWDFLTSTTLADSVTSGMTPAAQNFRGSNCTGTDATANRTLVLSHTPTNGVVNVTVNGTTLHEGASADFTITTNTITFKNIIWNDSYIRVTYHH